MVRDEWTHVRIRKTTKARLDAVIASLVRAVQAGHHDEDDWNVDSNKHQGVSIDDMVNRLLDAREKLKKRQADSRARKRRKQE